MSTWACDHQFRRACKKIGALFQFVRYSARQVLLCDIVMTCCQRVCASCYILSQNNTTTCRLNVLTFLEEKLPVIQKHRLSVPQPAQKPR